VDNGAGILGTKHGKLFLNNHMTLTNAFQTHDPKNRSTLAHKTGKVHRQDNLVAVGAQISGFSKVVP